LRSFSNDHMPLRAIITCRKTSLAVIRHVRQASALTMQRKFPSMNWGPQSVTIIKGTALKANAPD